MPKPVQANIAVIGAGVGVLTVVAGERHLPSKALIAAAAAARSMRRLNLPAPTRTTPSTTSGTGR